MVLEISNCPSRLFITSRSKLGNLHWMSTTLPIPLSLADLHLGDIVVLGDFDQLRAAVEAQQQNAPPGSEPESSLLNDDYEVIRAIAGRYASVVELPETNMAPWGGNVRINLGEDLELVVPMTAVACRVEDGLEDMPEDWEWTNLTNYEVEEPLEQSLDGRSSPRGTQTAAAAAAAAASSYTIPQYMAAETIQQAWRNHENHKAFKSTLQQRMQRISSTEQLVMEIAADIIKKKFQSYRKQVDRVPGPFPEFSLDGGADQFNESSPRPAEDVPLPRNPLSARALEVLDDSDSAPKKPLPSQGHEQEQGDSSTRPASAQHRERAHGDLFLEFTSISCSDLAKVSALLATLFSL